MTAKRDKVISGLACCHSMLHKLPHSDCEKCPYNRGSAARAGHTNPMYCLANLADDALDILKPCVIGIDEFHRGMVVWLEYTDSSSVVLAIGGASAGDSKCFIDELDRSLALKNSEYNVHWRAWSAEPMREQREAEPWAKTE